MNVGFHLFEKIDEINYQTIHCSVIRVFVKYLSGYLFIIIISLFKVGYYNSYINRDKKLSILQISEMNK